MGQSILQPVGDAYCVHALILRFLKSKLMSHPLRHVAVSRIVRYLGKLNVLGRFCEAGKTIDGVYALIEFWKTVEGFLDTHSDEWRISSVYTKSLKRATDIRPIANAGQLMMLMVRSSMRISSKKVVCPLRPENYTNGPL